MDQLNSALAIIPARGGSKGLLRKNLLPIGGKPLLAHSILAAKESQRVNRVVVSTEDDEIASVAKTWGAEVVQRPFDLATDEAPTDPVLEHALLHLEETEGFHADLVVLLQPTSPIRTPGLVDACISHLEASGSDSLLTVFEGHHFYWRRKTDGLIANYDPVYRPRRQDIPVEEQIMLENGSVYVTRRDTFLEYHSRLAGKIEWFVMSAEESLEIDSPTHLAMAEMIIRSRVATQSDYRRLDGIQLLVLDFDGVLTDNSVWVSENGLETVMNNRSDGMGLSMLKQQGIEAFVLSTEKNPVVSERCRKLGLQFQQGLADKAAALKIIVDERGIDLDHVAYLGNDVNDLDCMRMVGCSVAVADAYQVVIANADVVLTKSGGHGAVRELCDLILNQRITKLNHRGKHA